MAVLTQTVSGSPAVFTTVVNYVYADHIDTPRVITQASDNRMRWRWDQAEPFGTSAPNQNPASIGAFTYNPRFPGQFYDVESNLHYNYFRDYDPRIGRYVQSDPIGLAGGINTYAYVGGNPISRIDPTGLADLYFNAATNTLTIVSAGGAEGSYTAFNNAASTSRGVWPEGRFSFERYNSHPTRSASSDTGTNFIGFTVPGREFMGVHAGRQGVCDRANRCGAAHATLGCVRTTPEAMDAIRQLHLGGDPIRSFTVIRP